jgi:chemotaxis response regulator CheB
MPEAAIASGAADKVLPLSDIAAFLVELCRTA